MNDAFAATTEAMNTNNITTVQPIRWSGDAATGNLELLDQRRLPGEETWISIRTAESAANAIRDMVVRGAPAIGLAAAWGVVLAAQELGSEASASGLDDAMEVLAASRPTAVNLVWALQRMRAAADEGVGELVETLHAEAEAIRDEDIAANLQMGDLGAALLPDGARVLTHCNTGSLATAGYGTALGVIRSAWRSGRLKQAYAGETRPYLQGARLTMWELGRDGIPAELITDGMPGWLMRQGMIDAVVVGADRIAANGDAANKIGTYGLAVLARAHGIPFYVAAPISTIDIETPSGDQIEIEQRPQEEVTRLAGVQIAPEDARALHPAFDVTPADLITAIITERGVVTGPNTDSIRRLVADPLR